MDDLLSLVAMHAVELHPPVATMDDIEHPLADAQQRGVEAFALLRLPHRADPRIPHTAVSVPVSDCRVPGVVAVKNPAPLPAESAASVQALRSRVPEGFPSASASIGTRLRPSSLGCTACWVASTPRPASG